MSGAAHVPPQSGQRCTWGPGGRGGCACADLVIADPWPSKRVTAAFPTLRCRRIIDAASVLSPSAVTGSAAASSTSGLARPRAAASRPRIAPSLPLGAERCIGGIPTPGPQGLALTATVFA
jgi:hypothetical protein